MNYKRKKSKKTSSKLKKTSSKKLLKMSRKKASIKRKISTKNKSFIKRKVSIKKNPFSKRKVSTNLYQIGRGDQKLPSEIVEKILNIRQSKSLINKDLKRGIEMLEKVYVLYKNVIKLLQKQRLFGYEWKNINEILGKLEKYFQNGFASHNWWIIQDKKEWYKVSSSIIKTIHSLQDLKNVINIIYKNNLNKFQLFAPFVLLPTKIKPQFLEILQEIPNFSELSKIINQNIERFYDEEIDDFVIPNDFTLPTKDIIDIKNTITKDSDKILKTLELIINYYKKPQHKFYLY